MFSFGGSESGINSMFDSVFRCQTNKQANIRMAIEPLLDLTSGFSTLRHLYSPKGKGEAKEEVRQRNMDGNEGTLVLPY